MPDAQTVARSKVATLAVVFFWVAVLLYAMVSALIREEWLILGALPVGAAATRVLGAYRA